MRHTFHMKIILNANFNLLVREPEYRWYRCIDQLLVESLLIYTIMMGHSLYSHTSILGYVVVKRVIGCFVICLILFYVFLWDFVRYRWQRNNNMLYWNLIFVKNFKFDKYNILFSILIFHGTVWAVAWERPMYSSELL